jgi:hypothetical protein
VDAQVVDAEKPPSLADRFGELMRQMAESDAKIFRASGEYIAKARKSIEELADLNLDDRAAYAREQRRQAFVDGDKKRLAEWKKEERRLEAERIKQTQTRMNTSQSDMFGVGQYDTSTPLLNAVQEAPVKAKVEIPTTAYRKITTKAGQDRVQSAAESLVGWSTTPGTAPISMDEATRLVQAKGAILDPDAIPGLDMDMAREQRAMGRATPEVQAAYEEFYGLRRPEHLDVVKAAAVEQKLAIDNQMNQIRNQASKEGC